MFKKETGFKKCVCAVILISSLFSNYSFAGGSSAEVTLLSNAIAIGGEGLSQTETQTLLAQAVHTYEETAPADGRADRLQNALSELNVMTPEQARDFRSSTDTSESLQSVLSNMPGAQFSGYCKSMYEGYGAFAAISEGMIAYTGHPVEGLVILSVFFVGMAGTRGCL
jgi:hypothetical protein